MNNRYEKQFGSSKGNQWQKRASAENNLCTCKGKKKITIAMYGGEAHVMGSPENVEVVIVNLDKANRQMKMLMEDLEDEDFN